MAHAQTRPLTVFAPTKINLYLHITGRRDDGYHALDSLVAFTDIGDNIQIEPANEFSFVVQGPFASGFTAQEKESTPQSKNLLVKAAWAIAKDLKKDLNLRVILTKNIPLASGLGSGSSDAASVLRGLMAWWDMTPQALPLEKLMIDLGADVPVCLVCNPVIMRGIGENLSPCPAFDERPILLVHPGKGCSTSEVFSCYTAPFKKELNVPNHFNGQNDFINFLLSQENCLTKAALSCVPEISDCLTRIKAQPGCQLARMSGSGSACFGLFKTQIDALNGAEHILREKPDWWVQAGMLNRPNRY